MPFVLGQALSMQASHGGKANNATIDAPKMALLLRGGMLPQADGSPAAMRATRDLLRRRMSLSRKRAAWLAPLPQTNRQDTLPESGKQLAYPAHRPGGAARCPAPAVQNRMAVDRALSGDYEQWRSDSEWTLVQAAQQHAAQALSLLQSVPGLGTILRLGLFDAMQDMERLPRVQDCVSSGRLVTCAQESAGKRSGSSGTKSGHASLQGACAAAAVLLLRDTPAGQKALTRGEHK
jgi:hypothetical protein